MRKRLLSAALISLAMGGAAQAAVFYEPFDYNPGNLHLNVNANGKTWYSSATSGTADFAQVVAGSLSVSGLASSVGGSVVFGGDGRTDRIENVNVTSGTVYYSVAMKITDLSGAAAGGATIMGFNNTAQTSATDLTAGQPTNLVSRVIIKPVTATTYNVGTDKSSGNTPDFSFDTADTFTAGAAGDTVFIVGSYTFNTGSTTDDVGKLWINPASSTFGDNSLMPAETLNNTKTNDNSNVLTFILRQFTGLVPAGVQVDELRIGSTWADVTPTAATPEPGSLSLVGIATAGMLARRRKA